MVVLSVMPNHVLIIDPSPADTKSIKRVLSQHGVQKVTVAGRIAIGLQEMKTTRKEPIDLIVIDIEQPDANDKDSIIKLRNSPHASTCPIVALSQNINPAVMFACLDSGADEFVSKKTFFSNKVESLLTAAYARRQFRNKKL